MTHLFAKFGHEKSCQWACSETTKVDEGGHPAHLLHGEASLVLRDAVLLGELRQGGGGPGKDGAKGERADGGDQGAHHLASFVSLSPCLHFESQ